MSTTITQVTPKGGSAQKILGIGQTHYDYEMHKVIGGFCHAVMVLHERTEEKNFEKTVSHRFAFERLIERANGPGDIKYYHSTGRILTVTSACYPRDDEKYNSVEISDQKAVNGFEFKAGPSRTLSDDNIDFNDLQLFCYGDSPLVALKSTLYAIRTYHIRKLQERIKPKELLRVIEDLFTINTLDKFLRRGLPQGEKGRVSFYENPQTGQVEVYGNISDLIH